MSDPAVPACLSTLYSSKSDQRGGTLIAEDVVDLVEHRNWVLLIDAYRPERCESCLGKKLHGHGCRPRKLRMGDWSSEEEIRRFRCVFCGGIWQVLPAAIARYLHRAWGVVQSAAAAAKLVEASGAEARVVVPRRTAQRWTGRLLLTALMLTQALLGSGIDLGESISTGHCTRARLVDTLASEGVVQADCKLAQVAGLVHRVVPGLRLM